MDERERTIDELNRDYLQDLARRQKAAEQGQVMGLGHLGKAVDWSKTEPVNQCATTQPLPEELSLANIEAAMTYQPWYGDQVEAGNEVREALTMAAKAILRRCPKGPFRSVALRNIIDARMNANAAISFRGRF